MTALLLAACSPKVAEPINEAASVVASHIAPPIDTPSPAHYLGGVNLDEPLTILGAEPFWNISYGSGRVVFSSPDSHESRTTQTPFLLNNEGAAWHGDGMDIYLTPRHCSDGMSERRYPLTAIVQIGETKLKGCAANTNFLGKTPP
ncbi:MAG: hypothetical protein WBQ60_08555 [Asticcacaulis sp.]